MRVPVVVIVVALAGAACGGAGGEGLELAPGDDLLRSLRPDHVVARSPGNVPADLLAAQRRRAALTVEVTADMWVGGGPADPSLRRYAARMGYSDDLRRWSAPSAPPPPGVEDERRLTREDRDLRRFLMGGSKPRPADVTVAAHDAAVVPPPADAPSAWIDRQGGAMFWWEGTPPRLHAVAPESPGRLTVGALSVPVAELTAFEPAGGADRVPVRRLSPGGDPQSTRPALLLAAPGAVEMAVSEFHGEGLEVGVTVVDHGFVSEGGRLTRRAGAGDGAVFALEVELGGRAGRRWTATVAPGEERVALVDLSDLRGQSFRLRLLTEPGPADDRSWDYAAWTRLRVTGPPRRPPDRPHVVLIDIDTLRADRLGVYGHHRDTSPRLDAWARDEAVVYRDCVATSSWTIPATVSMFTGLAVHQHGMDAGVHAMTEAMAPLALLLSEAGYETRGLAELGMLSIHNGFDLGFDRFDVRSRVYDRPAVPDWSALLEWIDGRDSERPLFLFVQTYMVHAPFHDGGRFPEPDPDVLATLDGGSIGYQNVILPFLHGELELDAAQRAAVDRIYDEGVARMDDVVGDFLEGLERALDGQDRLVILTSDHGEELFEHEGLGHGHSLHGELLQVPLVVSYPGDDRPTGFDDRPASLVDIVPTVLAEVGLPRADDLPGRPLRGPTGPPRPRVAMLEDEVAVELQGLKLLRREGRASDGASDGAARTLLFDRRVDAGEFDDLSADTETVERLLSVLADYLRRHPARTASPGVAGQMDEERMEQLRALGYVDGTDG